MEKKIKSWAAYEKLIKERETKAVMDQRKEDWQNKLAKAIKKVSDEMGWTV